MRRRHGSGGPSGSAVRGGRRAQTEIIGLVLIVVLLAIGFLLYVKYSLSDKGDDTAESYEQTNLGQSFLNSIVKAEVPCGDSLEFTVEEHLQFIASGDERCPREPSEQSSKKVLSKYLNATLNKTLSEWGMNYRLMIVKKAASCQEERCEDWIGLPNYTNTNYPPKERCGPLMDHSTDHYVVRLPKSGYLESVELRLERC